MLEPPHQVESLGRIFGKISLLKWSDKRNFPLRKQSHFSFLAVPAVSFTQFKGPQGCAQLCGTLRLRGKEAIFKDGAVFEPGT